MGPRLVGLPGPRLRQGRAPGGVLVRARRRAAPVARPIRHNPILGWSLLLASAVAATASLALAAKTFGDVPAADGAGFSLAVAGGLVLLLRRPRWREWNRERRRVVGLLGLAITVNTTTLYLAIDRLPLGTAVTIEFLGPLALAVAHARRARDYVAAAFAILGVALAAGAALGTDPLGLALALVAGSTWALAVVMMRRVIGAGGLADSLLGAIVVAGVAAAPLAVGACLHISRLESVLLLLAVAIGGRILPYGLELVGLSRMSAGSAGVLLSIVPAIAAFSGFLLLGQPFRASQGVGLLIVILAGALVLRDNRPDRGNLPARSHG